MPSSDLEVNLSKLSCFRIAMYKRYINSIIIIKTYRLNSLTPDSLIFFREIWTLIHKAKTIEPLGINKRDEL